MPDYDGNLLDTPKDHQKTHDLLIQQNQQR